VFYLLAHPREVRRLPAKKERKLERQGLVDFWRTIPEAWKKAVEEASHGHRKEARDIVLSLIPTYPDKYLKTLVS